MSLCAVCENQTEGGRVVCSTDCLDVWIQRVEAAHTASKDTYANAMALYGAYQRGELQAEGLEAKARILAGWDPGASLSLTDEERDYMVRDAYNLDPAYPEAEAPRDDDAALSRWWLRAMQDYVDDIF